MRVNCKNGLEIENNPYINDITTLELKVGTNNVLLRDLPAIPDADFTIRYLPFANLLYVVLEEPYNNITRIYIIEQELVKNEAKLKNIYSTVEVDWKNPLEKFFRYNEEFERDNVRHCLCGGLMMKLPYAINANELRKQIDELLYANKETVAEPVADVEEEQIEETQPTQTISELAKQHGIAYNTLWGRIRNKHMSVEEALAIGNTRAKSKKTKHPDVTYEGKNLRELSKEYGIKYEKLWDRVHRQGRTIEEALAMGNKTKK